MYIFSFFVLLFQLNFTFTQDFDSEAINPTVTSKYDTLEEGYVKEDVIMEGEDNNSTSTSTESTSEPTTEYNQGDSNTTLTTTKTSETTSESTTEFYLPSENFTCPENFTQILINDNSAYCYFVINNTKFSPELCPYSNFVFQYELFNTETNFWIPAERLNYTVPYIWKSSDRYGEQVLLDFNHATRDSTKNCLIYKNNEIQPEDCNNYYNLICLYSYNFETSKCTRNNPLSLPSNMFENQCYEIVNKHADRSKFCNNLAEPLEEYQAKIIFYLMRYSFNQTCWIGLIQENGIWKWEKNNKTLEYYGYIDSYSEIYGLTTDNDWIFQNQTNGVDCAICENNYATSSNDVTIQLLENVKRLKVTVNYFEQINRLYCFAGDKLHLNTTRVEVETSPYYIPLKGYPLYYWCEAILTNSENIYSNVVLAQNSQSVVQDYVFYCKELTCPFYDTLLNCVDNLNEIAFKYHPKYILNSFRPSFINNLEIDPENIIFDIVLHFSTTTEDLNDISKEIKNFTQLFQEFNLQVDIFNTFYCLEEETIVSGIKLIWPPTKIGQTVTSNEICLNKDQTPVRRTCFGNFDNGAKWTKIDLTQCYNSDVSEDTKKLHELLNENITTDVLSKNLTVLTSNIKNKITVTDLDFTAKIIDKIAMNSSGSHNDLFTSISNIMESDQYVLKQGQNLLNSTDTILYNIDKSLMSENNIDFHNNKLMIKITDLNNIVGWSLKFTNDIYEATEIPNGTTLDEILERDPTFAAYLPNETLQQIKQELKNPKLIMIFYYNDNLFNEEEDTEITSGIVASIFIPGFSNYFETPMPVIFATKSGETNNSCVYWKYGINEEQISIKGKWMPSDTFPNNATFQICYYSHLTHFGMLVSEDSNKSIVEEVLSVITIIGTSLSLIAISTILFIGVRYKKWRINKGNILQVNFLLSVLLTNIMLFVSDAVPKGVFCIFCGAILHYAILSQFLWTLIISYLTYRRYAVVIFSITITNLVQKSMVIGWGLSFIPIIIVSSISVGEYNKNESGICYLSGSYLKFGVLFPVSVVLGVNVLFYVTIIYTLTMKRTRKEFHENEIQRILRVICLLFFQLGLTWIFGIVYAFEGELIFAYLFCFFCSLQGFVIAVAYLLISNTRTYVVKAFTFSSSMKTESTI